MASPEIHYQQVTPKIIEEWQAALTANPKAEWNENNIGQLLPFFRKVMPRIGENQSLMGLSIISLPGTVENEAQVVQYGLTPLLDAGILTLEEAIQFRNWFTRVGNARNNIGIDLIMKDFQIDGTKYRLITDYYSGYRDLNLLVVS